MSKMSMNDCSTGTTHDVAVSGGTPKPSKPENNCTRSATVLPEGSNGTLRSLVRRCASESNVYLRELRPDLSFHSSLIEYSTSKAAWPNVLWTALGRIRISGPVAPPVNPGSAGP